ncbi:MAG: amidase [Acidobacteria bacterium]|nr:amidase [Acidobacteriota bacterium]
MSSVEPPRPVSTRRAFLSRGLGAGVVAALARSGASAPGDVLPSGLAFASAVEAARALAEGRLSSLELTRLMLDRIDRFDPTLNAYVNVLSDSALSRARAADDARARGESWGPLHGLPVAIKESFGIAGVPQTVGLPSLADHRPAEDSAAVARLRAAGAIVLGNTNVPLLLWDLQSYNEVYGTTNNPWDLERTPGGSSGGNAAALAAGLGYVAVGSDIGGSIRTPAHFCGVYGHKPTLNVVPRRGQIPPLPGSPPQPPTDLPVAGPMARHAGDLALALEVLGGPDGDDATAYRWTLPPPRHDRLADHRIGYVLDDPLCPPSSDVRETLEAAVAALRKAGARLEEGWPDGVVPREQFETYWYLLSAFFAFDLKDDDVEEERARAADPAGGLDAQRAQARVDPHKHFLAASSRRMVARAAWQDYFRTHDAFLMPTALVAAFPHDHRMPMEARRLATPEGPRAYRDLMFWISFATLTGLPATTAPVGLTRDGLPCGIQILGPYLEDATPIGVAAEMADVVGGFRAPQGYEA